jgi:putative endonuclease
MFIKLWVLSKRMFNTSYTKGIISELYVLAFLILKGYKPIKWRMRNSVSEIDLIVKKKNILIAIEVKYRKQSDDGLYAIHPRQQKKIRDAFGLFTNRYVKNYAGLRCDVCVVNNKGYIQHLINAF